MEPCFLIKYSELFALFATLAQMVEHLTCNEDVVSSNLTGGSTLFCPVRLVRSGHRVFIPATGVRISYGIPFLLTQHNKPYSIIS